MSIKYSYSNEAEIANQVINAVFNLKKPLVFIVVLKTFQQCKGLNLASQQT